VEHQPGLERFTGTHHRVIEHAHRLTAAVPENGVALADTARSFLAFWQGDASILFRKEEEVLLPAHGASRLDRLVEASPFGGGMVEVIRWPASVPAFVLLRSRRERAVQAP
jgi:hypothetical protein